MNAEQETIIPSPINTEISSFTQEGILKLKQMSFDFLNPSLSQDESTRGLFDSGDETHDVIDGLNRLHIDAFVSGIKIVNICEDSARSSNANVFKTTIFNFNTDEEQERRDKAAEPLNSPMEEEIPMNRCIPALQGEGSTQVTTPYVPEIAEIQQNVICRRGPARAVKHPKEEELMKNELNNLQEFVPLKKERNVRVTKTITKKNQLKLESRGNVKLNRQTGFRNHISLIGKAVQHLTACNQEFRNELTERLENVTLSAVTEYLTEKIKGRKNAKDQSKLANKNDVAKLLKITANDLQAQKKRGAMVAFELFLDGEYYGAWLDAHFEKKWKAQGKKGENQRDAFVALKDEVRKSFLEF